MKKKTFKKLREAAVLSVPIALMSKRCGRRNNHTARKPILEKCREVITTSEDKLSVAPEITDVSDQKRIAVFTLIDGTLTITCDGEEGKVTVSTDTN